MNTVSLDGAFVSRTPLDATEDEEIADVRRQAEEWIASEPNIESATIGRIYQPSEDRRHWFVVEITARLRSQPEQSTIWDAA